MRGQAAAAVVAVSLKGPTGVMEQAVAKKRMILVGKQEIVTNAVFGCRTMLGGSEVMANVLGRMMAFGEAMRLAHFPLLPG